MMADTQIRTGIKMTQAAARNLRLIEKPSQPKETEHIKKPRLHAATPTKETSK
jgi:hypothetical protein